MELLSPFFFYVAIFDFIISVYFNVFSPPILSSIATVPLEVSPLGTKKVKSDLILQSLFWSFHEYLLRNFTETTFEKKKNPKHLKPSHQYQTMWLKSSLRSFTKV